jgi:hypothetical protein
MVSENPNRVPEQAIVFNPKIVLPEGHPDAIWFNPSAIITTKSSEIQYGRYLTTPFASLIQATPRASEVVEEVSLFDVPDLSDITIYSGPTLKYNAVTKKPYYEYVFKVKNSSKEKINVEGVDARVLGTEPELNA